MYKAIIYGDISPNVIDGSSIWLISVTETLSKIFDEVHLLLKMPAQNRRLLEQLDNVGNITIHEPNLHEGEEHLTVTRATEEVALLAEEIDPTVVVARGMDLCNSFCRHAGIASRLWAYITDIPFPIDQLSENGRTRLRRIAVNSQRLFAQTEGARSYLESIIPEAAGKTVLMRPMIPNESFVDLKSKKIWTRERPLRLIYAGKLAEGWKTLEMLALPKALQELGIEAELRVVGDKFNRSKSNPSWIGQMQEALREADRDPNSGVTWVGGLSREESLKEIARADIGIGWRTVELDGNLEVSTKTLEYSAGGTIPLINRTNDNIEIFGPSYPFFVNSADGVVEAAKVIQSGLENITQVRDQLPLAVKFHSFEAAAERLRTYFRRAGTVASNKTDGESLSHPIKLLVAAHDFKFLGELLDQLQRNPNYEVRFDKWETLHAHDQNKSRKLLEWADTVFCEWAGPNLKWYSQNLGEGKRLVSRLHGFELRGPWMKQVDFSRVNQMIFVSDFYKDKAIEQLGIASEITLTIPNMVDVVDFDRSKLPNSQFNLGMIGMVPFLKRPDRALDFLERLIEKDDRFTLFIKGRAPWEYPYEWENPVQRQAYLEFYNRLAADEVLRQRVVFEPFGPDISSWLRNIGVILSPSDQESFHLATAEGMASRSIPIVWMREGARSVFGEENVYENLDKAVDLVYSARDPELHHELGERARCYAHRFDIDQTMALWHTALHSAVSGYAIE